MKSIKEAKMWFGISAFLFFVSVVFFSVVKSESYLLGLAILNGFCATWWLMMWQLEYLVIKLRGR